MSCIPTAPGLGAHKGCLENTCCTDIIPPTSPFTVTKHHCSLHHTQTSVQPSSSGLRCLGRGRVYEPLYRVLRLSLHLLLRPPPSPFPSSALPDTIRKMKNDFRKMEDEMDRLATNMAVITDFSARISATLQDRHERITKLAGGPCPRGGAKAGHPQGFGANTTYPRPQGSMLCCGSCSSFSSCPHASPSVWNWVPMGRRCATRAARGPCCSSTSTCLHSVPSRMTARSSRLAWPSSYASASGVTPGPSSYPFPLLSYLPQPHPKFCLPALPCHLPPGREGGSGAPEQAECVELLLALGEPAEELCEEFLAHARGRLEEELRSLEAELGPSPPAPDVLEFTDRGGSGFVGGLCQVAATYQELFSAQGPAGAEKLAAFTRELGGRYFALVERRLAQEQGGSDNSLLVRALDRFHRRLRAPGALLAAAGLAEAATEIVERVARERLGHHLQGLRAAFLGCLTDVRQALAAPRLAGKEGPGLAELLANVASSILSHIKASLAAVHLFTAKEVSFSNKPYFRVWPAPGHFLIHSAD